MVRIAIIVGNHPAHRHAADVGRWVHGHALDRAPAGIAFELIDLDEPARARELTRVVGDHDGFVLVVSGDDGGSPGTIQDALRHPSVEWSDKAVGFVSHGARHGVCAVEHLRLLAAEAGLADVRPQVILPALDAEGGFAPDPWHVDDLSNTLHSVVIWAEAMATVRAPAPT